MDKPTGKITPAILSAIQKQFRLFAVFIGKRLWVLSIMTRVKSTEIEEGELILRVLAGVAIWLTTECDGLAVQISIACRWIWLSTLCMTFSLAFRL